MGVKITVEFLKGRPGRAVDVSVNLFNSMLKILFSDYKPLILLSFC